MTTPEETAPLRLALVDDTPDIRDLLKMAFERTRRFLVVAGPPSTLEPPRVVGPDRTG